MSLTFEREIAVLNEVITATNPLVKDIPFPNDVIMHQIRSAFFAINIAISLGYSDSDVFTSAQAALLHDVGKAFLPQDVLQKPTALSDEEKRIIKKHPALGYGFLKDRVDDVVSDAVLHHHERLTGNGYPDGLRLIHPVTQIVSVSDVYDALISKRPYKKAYSLREAHSLIFEDVGLNAQFCQILCNRMENSNFLEKDFRIYLGKEAHYGR